MKPGRLALAAHGQQEPCATNWRHPPSASCPYCSHKVWGCSRRIVALLSISAELKERHQCLSDQDKARWKKETLDVQVWRQQLGRCSVGTGSTESVVTHRPVGDGCTRLCCSPAKRRRFCRSWLILPGVWVLGGTITAVDSFILFAKSRKWKCCRRDSIISPVSLFNSGTKCTFIPVHFAATNWGFLPLTPGCFHLFCQPIPCQSKDIHY